MRRCITSSKRHGRWPKSSGARPGRARGRSDGARRQRPRRAVRAPLGQARVDRVQEPWVKQRREHPVHGMVHHAVDDRSRRDQPPLGLVDAQQTVAARPVGPRPRWQSRTGKASWQRGLRWGQRDSHRLTDVSSEPTVLSDKPAFFRQKPPSCQSARQTTGPGLRPGPRIEEIKDQRSSARGRQSHTETEVVDTARSPEPVAIGRAQVLAGSNHEPPRTTRQCDSSETDTSLPCGSAAS